MKLKNKFDTSKLLFSPSANILCHYDGKHSRSNKWYVINGHYNITIKGDTVRFWKKGWECNYLMNKCEITDWEQYTREEFNKKYPYFGY